MLILLCAILTLRQDPTTAVAVRQALEPFVASSELSGAVAVVGRKSGVLAHEAIGIRDMGTGDPMPKDALFRIASMTKPMTALVVMQLVDEGKIDLDAPLAQYLPEFRDMPLIKERTGTRVVLDKPARQPTRWGKPLWYWLSGHWNLSPGPNGRIATLASTPWGGWWKWFRAPGLRTECRPSYWFHWE